MKQRFMSLLKLLWEREPLQENYSHYNLGLRWFKIYKSLGEESMFSFRLV